MPLSLATPIENLPSVGPVYAKRLGKLEISTLDDLITHFPFRYDDFSLISPINRLQIGETVTIQGTIISITTIFTKRGKRMQKAVVSDATGTIGVVWFNQPYLVSALPVGSRISLSGTVSFFGREKVLASPEYELFKPTTDSQQLLHTGRLVPVYPETYGLSSKWLRNKIFFLLRQLGGQLTEYLPEPIITQNQLMDYANAIRTIHFPSSKEEENQARRRLAFDELFLTQLASGIRRKQWHQETVGKQFNIANWKLQIGNFIAALPFTLTNAQKRCLSEILNDLGSTRPMNRLLQGDVGSGKTVVAAIAMYVAHLNGFQSLCMAPTEILAQQHFKTLNQLLTPLGISVVLKTASNKKNADLTKANVLVGTQALLFEQHAFTHVGLVVIDEQHRFGVRQRTELATKGIHPHLLSMTATPIPRSVALTLYGELDLSYIDEMPQGRQLVKTWLVPNTKRDNANQWIAKEIAAHHSQAFIICPLIEESEHETLQSVKSATVEFERLKKIFTNFDLGLLHGRMKPKEKDAVLDQFRNNQRAILVATPVVEVGIDIPNATIMLIEASERFGLAQLHQLRGRVGRGEKQSYCLLFTESTNPATLKRLTSLETIFNGAKLAELDLRLRGAGDIVGTRQHGFTSFKVATLSDTALISSARAAAAYTMTNNLDSSPLLQEKLKKYTIQDINPN